MAPFEVTPENTIHGVVNVIEPTAAGSTVYLSTQEDEPRDFVATFKQRVPVSYLERRFRWRSTPRRPTSLIPTPSARCASGTELHALRCRYRTRDDAPGPIWGPFAVIRDNIESLGGPQSRLVAAAPARQSWRWRFRSFLLGYGSSMGLYSATAVIPATGVLYALTLAATRGEQVSRELAILSWRQLALPSFRMLTPLYGVFGLLIWLAILVGPTMPV